MSILTATQPASATIDRAAVIAAIASIDDPEYPGVSIVDLGLFESVDVADGIVSIELVPTFSGCPALAMIASDVSQAVEAVSGVHAASVTWRLSPPWTTDRVTDIGRAALAREFTVSIRLGDRMPECPICGAATTENSMFGPSRCRAVSTCDGCGETVEMMRS